jgi:hypothetical protein
MGSTGQKNGPTFILRKKGKNMKRILLSSVFAITLSTGAIAGGLDVPAKESTVAIPTVLATGPIVTGSIEVEVAENDAGEYAATTTFGAGIVTPGLFFGELGVESIDGDTFEVNKWYIGAMIGDNATLSFGDHDGGVFIGAYSDYATIADPEINEALIFTLGDASAALGFTDITDDVSDISNVQGAYTLDAGVAVVTVSADYNFNTEEYTIGTRTNGVQLGVVSLGSTLSYSSASETLAYEMDASTYGVTVYVNGDNDDALRNVGAGYNRALGNLTIFANVNYDVNTEKVAPKAGVSFNF